VKQTVDRERQEIRSTFRPNIANRSDRLEDVGEGNDIKRNKMKECDCIELAQRGIKKQQWRKIDFLTM
jgi:hypothetical protein